MPDDRKAALKRTVLAMIQELELAYDREISPKRAAFIVLQFERDGWFPSEVQRATAWCLKNCRMMPVYYDFCVWHREQYDSDPGEPDQGD